MANIDPKSRDYDPKEIVEDPRIKQTTKEMIITFCVYACFVILMIFNICVVGHVDPANYSYILGLPTWIFFEICIIILYVVAVNIVTTYVFKNMDLSPDGEMLDDVKG